MKKIKNLTKIGLMKKTVLKGLNLEVKLKDYINNTMDIYYKLLHDVNITVDGKSTQIDLILLTYAGIHVIESKNHKGIISGNINDLKWENNFYNNSKYLENNPISQNEYHIDMLSKYLKLPKDKFFSYIIYGNDAKLNINNNKRFFQKKHLKILYANELVEQIKYDLKHESIKLSYESIDKIYYILKE